MDKAPSLGGIKPANNLAYRLSGTQIMLQSTTKDRFHQAEANVYGA